MKSTPLVLGAVAGAGLVLLAASEARAQPAAAPPAPRSVTVTGHGEARGRPDQARLVLGVMTEAQSAQAALQENTRRVRGVLAALRAAGIPQPDIQTTQVSVDPVYADPRPEGDRQLTGYRVVNQVGVTVRRIDALGALLDAAVKSGANQVLGLSFELSDDRELERRARAEAMAKAKGSAEHLASLARARLGGVLSIREAGPEGPRPLPMRALALESARGVPVEPGEREVTYDVEVTYALE